MAKIINSTENKVNLPLKDKIVEEDIQVVFEGESGNPIVVDSLDESLLVEENVGKLYKVNGKLYKIVYTADISDLNNSVVVVPPGWEAPANYMIRQSFISESEVYNDPIIISIGYGENIGALNNVVCISNSLDEFTNYYPENSITLKFGKVTHYLYEGQDSGGYEQRQLLQWLLNNYATFNGKLLYKFEELANGKPNQINSLDETLLVSENNGKIYKYNGNLYQVETGKVEYYEGIISEGNLIELPTGWSVPAGYGKFDFVYRNLMED